MGYCKFLYFWGIVLIVCVENIQSKDVLFNDNYDVLWGKNNSLVLDQGRQLRLIMDTHSGAGFQSKLVYGSGLFHLKIKLPNRDSAGVVTAFYLSSKGKYHDEVDIEFLGNKIGKPISLQTNLFVHGNGKKEQRINLWFDPTADFHSYKILWNPHHIVFYVDNTPIRVFKNKTRMDVMYLTQAMRVEGSIWDGESWATDGGQTKTNWSNAPFLADFRDFGIDGCSIKSHSSIHTCSAFKYWWNWSNYSTLTADDYRQLNRIRQNYMIYDYCNDTKRIHTRPPECASNT